MIQVYIHCGGGISLRPQTVASGAGGISTPTSSNADVDSLCPATLMISSVLAITDI